MQILNLVRPEKSDIKYHISRFPDGDVRLELEGINRKDNTIIVCRIRNAEELYILMQAGDILNRHEVMFSLRIYYLMGMRMDRVMDFNMPFNLKIVANMINSINPAEVHTFEPHSDVTTELIKNWHGNLSHPMPNFSEYLPMLPDSGAAARYQFLYNIPVLSGNKTRDPEGGITEYSIINEELLADENHKDKPIIVLDDLCDGGSTFVELAKTVKAIDPNRKLAIWITHMVNELGIERLKEWYDEIYFTNSYKDWDEEITDYIKQDQIRVIKVV